jgi:hypothetical protein
MYPQYEENRFLGHLQQPLATSPPYRYAPPITDSRQHQVT